MPPNLALNGSRKWMLRTQKLQGAAIVYGGSIAGTVTAHIIIFADHFERVILGDPEIDDTEKFKTRVMQYNAAHVFLSLFLSVARRLWPNFDNETKAAGGRLVPADTQVQYSGVPLLTPSQEYPPGCLPDTLVIRRSTAQAVLRRLLMRDPTSANKRDGTQMLLNDAALVAGCSGTTQAGLKWLRSAGFFLPENIRRSYQESLSYATLFFGASGAGNHASHSRTRKKDNTSIWYCPTFWPRGILLVLLIIGSSGDSDLPRIASDVVPFIQDSEYIPPSHRGSPRLSQSYATVEIPLLTTLKFVRSISNTLTGWYWKWLMSLTSNPVCAAAALNKLIRQGFAKIVLNGLALNILLNTINPNLDGLPRDFRHATSRKMLLIQTAYGEDATRLHDYGSPMCQPMEGETRESGRFLSSNWYMLPHRMMKLHRLYDTFAICSRQTGYFWHRQ
ncbi:hypothetical protein DFH09DRAFT_1276888 [Mycena vulgaris]|nr:hypothetical protein DFH09DRAFT_1276888 [Mycena vulgaris]